MCVFCFGRHTEGKDDYECCRRVIAYVCVTYRFLSP